MIGESDDVAIIAVEEAGVSETNGGQKMNSAKKQARLPFKILDQHGTQVPSKKRKLSDDESMCRTTRTNGSKLIDKKLTPVKGSNKVLIVDENEVSSSSEPDSQGGKKTAKAGLMKFFCPATQLKEVSTSVPSEEVDKDNGNEKDVSLPASANTRTLSGKGGSETSMENADLVAKTGNENRKSDMGVREFEAKIENEAHEHEIRMSISDEESDMDVSAIEADDSLLESSHSGDEEMGNIKDMSAVSETSLDQEEERKAQTTRPDDTAHQSDKESLSLTEKQRNTRKEMVEKREKTRTEKQRQKEEARIEKQKKKQEEKDRKQAEREKKVKEKQEKREAFEKEKFEKQKAKEEDRKKKQEALESERLKKEEERKKKEAEKVKKEEEKKQREEEKLRKEEERKREEEEQEKKKAHQKAIFMSFFKKPEKTDEVASVETERTGKFMAFTLKKGMALAPPRRDKLETSGFDKSYREQSTMQKLYIDELMSGDVKPRMCERTIKSTDRDVIILDEDAPDFYKAKFLKFHENNRPAYYGTWRKKSKMITGKNPFKKDESLFDYELDSDEEWEEEEPGESLSNSEGEDECDNEDNGDDEDEDGFFVPHGYLSDGEGCEDDDDVTPERMKARQQARQRAFEVELKKQCQKLNPVVTGLCWQYSTPCLSSSMEKSLADFECVALRAVPIGTSLCVMPEPGEDGDISTKDDRRMRRMSVPEKAMPDLCRLIHGNVNGMKKLVKEFLVYWRQKSTPADNIIEGTVALEKTLDNETENEDATEKSQPTTPRAAAPSPSTKGQISKRQLELKLQAIAEYKKGHYARKCWYVKEDILKKYALESLPVPTEWTYVTDVEKDSGRNTPTCRSASKMNIKQFAVKTTSDELFTSPSAASPKQKIIRPSPLASPPQPETKTSPLIHKPARRVQLNTLGVFMSKSSQVAANPGAQAANSARILLAHNTDNALELVRSDSRIPVSANRIISQSPTRGMVAAKSTIPCELSTKLPEKETPSSRIIDEIIILD